MKSVQIAESVELSLIAAEYSGQVAKRSGVPLIHHIIEGLWVLEKMGASLVCQKAYALHPLTQSDELLAKYLALNAFSACDANALLLAMEYRHTANAYLSKHHEEKSKELKLSVLKEVNEMLVADKVQNCKDFQKYHKGTHPKSELLESYFTAWFKALGISESDYALFCGEIERNTYMP